MNIHAVGPAAVSRALLSDPVPGGPATPTPPAAPNEKAVERATISFGSPLASGMQRDLLAATQEFAMKENNPDHVPPAQAARAALEADPSLEGQPFGTLVSRLARGEGLPPTEVSSSTPEDIIIDVPVEETPDVASDPASDLTVPEPLPDFPEEFTPPVDENVVLEELLSTPPLATEDLVPLDELTTSEIA